MVKKVLHSRCKMKKLMGNKSHNNDISLCTIISTFITIQHQFNDLVFPPFRLHHFLYIIFYGTIEHHPDLYKHYKNKDIIFLQNFFIFVFFFIFTFHKRKGNYWILMISSLRKFPNRKHYITLLAFFLTHLMAWKNMERKDEEINWQEKYKFSFMHMFA